MASSYVDLAKDAFARGDYQMAIKITERYLISNSTPFMQRIQNSGKIDAAQIIIPNNSTSIITAQSTMTTISTNTTSTTTTTTTTTGGPTCMNSVSVPQLPMTTITPSINYHKKSLDIYYGYGDALACSGRLDLGLDVYSYISEQLGYSVPLEKLQHISLALLQSVTMIKLASSTSSPPVVTDNIKNNSNNNNNNNNKLLMMATQCNNRHRRRRRGSNSNNNNNNNNNNSNSHHHHHNNFKISINKRSHQIKQNHEYQYCQNERRKLSALTQIECQRGYNKATVNLDLVSPELLKFSNKRKKLFHTLEEAYYENIDDVKEVNGDIIIEEDQLELVDEEEQENMNNTIGGQRRRHNNNNNTNNKQFRQKNYSFNNNNKKNNNNNTELVDPLCCGICKDLLRCPVTAICGHTFCAACCYDQTECIKCGKKFVSFKQDVTVLSLVEKWWAPEANDRAIAYLEQNLLDDALKSCNESLEKCPNNYHGLLLRSEILYWLNQYKSSLADAENALKSRPNSYKAHIRRAYAFTGLGLTEEAIIAYCIAVAINKSTISSVLIQDVAKLLQRLLLAPSSVILTSQSSSLSSPSIKRSNNSTAATTSTTIHQMSSNKTLTSNDAASSVLIMPAIHHPYSKHRRHQHLTTNTNRKYLNLRHGDNGDDDVIDDDDVGDGDDDVHDVDDDNVNVDIDIDDDEWDQENSSCSDVEDEPQIKRRKSNFMWPKHQQQQHPFKNRYNQSNGINGGSISTKITNSIPKPNPTFRKFLARIRLEIEKTERQDGISHLLKVNPSLIDLSDFECVLCYRTFWKPVVTPCGHTYCLVCLDRCLYYSSHCPLCKSSFGDDYSLNIVRNSLSQKYVTKFLEIAMQRFIPEAYQQRKLQESENEPFVPVFICTTAFPYVSCPLFVHESRYRLMIRRAIESGERQFGIVQPLKTAGSKRYSDFGTMLNIRDCVLLSDDGRSILSTVGGRRFRVLDRNEKDGYDTANVQYIYDIPVDDPERLQYLRELHASVFLKAVIWYKSLPDKTKEDILKSFGGMPGLELHWETVPDGPAWAWYIIALLPLNQPLKVEILASTSLEKRLLAINKTLEYVAAQKRRSAVCVQSSCDGSGVQTCQAIECCQQRTTTTVVTTNHHHLVVHENVSPDEDSSNTTTSIIHHNLHNNNHHHNQNHQHQSNSVIIVDVDDLQPIT